MLSADTMRIAIVGGGPCGLYFALLMKKEDPSHEVTVYERNRSGDTFGFGVVFSDQTLGGFAEADPESYAAIEREFAHWDDIDIHYGGRVLRSTGHGFAGLSRKVLLEILEARARALGVTIHLETERTDIDALSKGADLVLVADGVNSAIRSAWSKEFQTDIDFRPNHFVWLGTTFPFEAFTFYFRENEHGLFRVHAYRYAKDQSTFIVECTESTFKKTGLTIEDDQRTAEYCQKLFEKELAGHPLLKNRSVWRQFPVIKNGRFSKGNVVLGGDALHTAHFSIGSGTKLAMEDAIVLRDALRQRRGDIPGALARYEEIRRPQVESLQRAAKVSMTWFEETERYMHLAPEQFAASLLTRSLRVTHENLRLRDPSFVRTIDAWFHTQAGGSAESSPPPMFTPLRLRGLALENRIVVSPMCQYSAQDGTVNDWHLVHLGSRAMGGAGLVVTEMTGVSRDARITPGCAGMYLQEHVDGWRRIVDFVHTHSPAKIAMQLGHAGRKGATKLLWEGDNQPLETGAWPIFSASSIPYSAKSQIPREMTRKDMDVVTEDFRRAARMANEAGFDMLEIHAAHGYLLASFLSPLTNQRKDDWGGTIDARARFPLEVFRAVRDVWPSEKPISVRVSATDWKEGGLSSEDLLRLARLFKDAGVDALDVSTGQTVEDQKPEYGRLFQVPYAERIRLEVGLPTMAVGAISSFSDANSILAAGRADLCVLARAHLYDPYWTRHAANEQGVSIVWPDQYRAVERYTVRFK